MSQAGQCKESVMSKVSSLILFVVSPVGTALLNVGQRIRILAITIGVF
jgi:hypothetical protein